MTLLASIRVMNVLHNAINVMSLLRNIREINVQYTKFKEIAKVCGNINLFYIKFLLY